MGKYVKIILIALISMISIQGCALMEDSLLSFKSSVKGLPMSIQTYSDSGKLLDKITGESVDFASDNRFALYSNGETVEKSTVINATVGGEPLVNVGTTLIAYDQAMENVFDRYAKTVDINNLDRSTPILNHMVNMFKNDFSGNSYLILVKSQTSEPIATFVGKEIRYSPTSIDKSTSFLIDGKRLFLYRCSYSMYSLKLLEGSAILEEVEKQ